MANSDIVRGVLIVLLLGGVLAGGCGGRDADFPDQASPVPTAAQDKAGPPPGSLWRSDVLTIVDAGLGRFLQRVDVEPSFDAKGKFQGFRILSLHPPDFWDGVDLRPGDVILQVNGQKIERETEAFSAFEGLKTAEELRVHYLRNGQERTLSYSIVEKKGGNAAPKNETAKQKSPDAG